MLLLFTLLPNLEFNPCPAALNKSQRSVGVGGVRQASRQGCVGGRDVINQATKSSLFLLQSGCGLVRTGVLEVPAPMAHSAGVDPSRVIPRKPCLPPCLSLPLGPHIPAFTQLSFFFTFSSVSLPSVSTFTLLSSPHDLTASSFSLLLCSAPHPSHPLPPPLFLILLLSSPPTLQAAIPGQ